jgi:Transposase DDE domain
MPRKRSERKPISQGPRSVANSDGELLTSEDVSEESNAGGGTGTLRSKDITGLKYFEMISPLLRRLHEDGCQRDKANQRELHYDQYCILILLYLFNPTVTSLRAIQQASELSKVKKKLGCSRASLGSLSEASRLFDSDRLKEIIAELGADAEQIGRHEKLRGISQNITLVDGSLVSALPNIMQASLLKATEGSGLVKWRLHTHFEVDRYVPTRIDVTPDGGGQDDERATLGRTLESDRLYVMDRGYAKFGLFNDIVAKHSSYVCRLRDNSAYDVVEDRVLTEADQAADVLSDQVISIGKTSKTGQRPNHAVRLVCVKCSPHTSRGKSKLGSTAPSSDGILRIATNLLDVPAEIIALIYSQRWIIEIFFRFFKQLLGCSHLISHGQNGIEIQTYCAIIACLLINLWTGRKPTKRTFEMLSYYFTGLASEEELIAHLARLKALDEAKTKNS